MEPMAIVVIIGGIALLVGLFGGGIKVKEFEVPQLPGWVRCLSGLVGVLLIAIAIWLSAQEAAPPAPLAATPEAAAVSSPPAQTITPGEAAAPTPAATATPAPIDTPPPPPPLVEIFPQVEDGVEFVFINSGGSLKNEFTPAQNCLHTGLYGLRLTYEMEGEGNGGWGVLWDNAPAGHFNASDFSALTFWVKGKSGGETFQIGLKDAAGTEAKIESKLVVVVTEDWTMVNIPLDKFEGTNAASISNINFGFNKDHSAGSLCIDDIAFAP